MKHLDCFQKRILPVLLCLVFVFSSAFLTACDDNNDGSKADGSEAGTAVTPDNGTTADPGTSGQTQIKRTYDMPPLVPDQYDRAFVELGGNYDNPFLSPVPSLESLCDFDYYLSYIFNVMKNTNSSLIKGLIASFYMLTDANRPVAIKVAVAGTENVFSLKYVPGNTCCITLNDYPILGINNGQIVDMLSENDEWAKYANCMPFTPEEIEQFVDRDGIENTALELFRETLSAFLSKFDYTSYTGLTNTDCIVSMTDSPAVCLRWDNKFCDVGDEGRLTGFGIIGMGPYSFTTDQYGDVASTFETYPLATGWVEWLPQEEAVPASEAAQ